MSKRRSNDKRSPGHDANGKRRSNNAKELPPISPVNDDGASDKMMSDIEAQINKLQKQRNLKLKEK